MKNTIIIVLLFIANFSLAQALNEYQYAIIPSKCTFLKESNQYRLNTTTKAFFQQKGFITYYDNETLPDEVTNNNCKALYVAIQENNTMFSTKLKVVISDCKNKILMTSQEGSTREKELSIAYNEALIIALKSMQNMNYKYSDKASSKPVFTSQDVSGVSEVYSEMQTTTNGFNFVNKQTKMTLALYKTSDTIIYIAKSNDKNGIVFQKNGNWFFEYYNNDKLVSEKIELKF